MIYNDHDTYEWFVLYTPGQQPQIRLGRAKAVAELIEGRKLTPKELKQVKQRLTDFPIGERLIIVGEIPYSEFPDRILWRVEEPGDL